MNFRKLEIFYHTALNLNMSKVAKSMFVSQPSISQTIQELESELECNLFDRMGKKLYLTHEGEVFLEYTRRILNLYEEGVVTLREQRMNRRGKIIIGASTTIGIYILPTIIKEFSKEFCNIDISIIIENTSNIEKLLLENKIDFAFIEGKVTSDEIIKEGIWTDEIVFVLGNENPMRGIGEFEKDELINQKLIMREWGSGTREIVEGYLESNNIPYNVFLEIGNTEAIKNIVEANIGVGCISLMCVKDMNKRGEVAITRIKDSRIFRELFLIRHKDKYISKNMELFIGFSKKYEP